MTKTNIVKEQQRPSEPECCEHALREQEEQAVWGRLADQIIDTELE